MPTKSKYDLEGAQHVRIPREIWNAYVDKFGKEEAPDQIRDDLDLCIAVNHREKKNND